MNSETKGALLVLATAMISGFSIFLNKFAVSGISAGSFALLKAVIVSGILLSAIIAAKKLEILKKLSLNDWKKLAIIGFSGGGLAFLLFFQGLASTSAANASFIHKLLFVFAIVFGIFLLKEKIDWKLLSAGLAVFAGLFAIFRTQITSFQAGDWLILGAVIIWSFEIVLSKKALKNLDGTTVAFGRMFFGSIFLLAFIILSGKAGELAAVSIAQLEWALITGVLLFLYVFTFYNGLNRLSVSKAAIILLAAIPVTAILSAVNAKPITALEVFANLLIIAGVAFVLLKSESLKQFPAKKLNDG